MRQRMDHLEDMVTTLIAERQQIPLTLPSSDGVCNTPESLGLEPGPARSGKTVMDGVHSVHLGDDDWRVVLEEVITRLLFAPRHLPFRPLILATVAELPRSLPELDTSWRNYISCIPS